MYRKGLNIIKFGNKIPVSENRTVIEFTVRGTSFPDSTTGGLIFYVVSSITQKMYIDFNDGTGIHDFQVTNSWGVAGGGGTIMHYYQDLVDVSKIGTIDMNYSQERVIKIWFDYPSRISLFRINNIGLYGNFPKNIGNYSLSLLEISGSRSISDFPVNFRGGSWGTLTLNNISSTKPTLLPKWISQSRINVLRLQNVFDFSGSPTATNLNSISTVDRLNTLTLSTNNMGNNSFPTTLKNITTLRTLYIGGNIFTTLPAAITDCTQLTSLIISDADGYGYTGTMTSWGAGIANMVNLNTLKYAVTGSNFPVTVPTGAINAIALKNIVVRTSYRTSQARTDDFVTNWYDFVVANALLVSGNTKFRQMVFDMGNAIGGSTPLRPSGGATPSSLVDPPNTPIEKIYFLCKKYAHTWTIRNLSDTNVEIIAP